MIVSASPRLRSAATGGAALGPDTFKFFRAMGVPLRTLYGQTETLGAFTLHPPDAVDPDTTGIAMGSGIEIEVRDPDVQGVGEIVVRHPNMFLGYYKSPEASAADLRDGWMHSGDAGYFNDNKQLVVIDRIKDLAQTARGERFSPQYIENKLKFSPYIAETVVLGDNRDALAAMICIRFSIISKWAEKNRISFTTYTDLSSRPEVYEMILQESRDGQCHAAARAAHRQIPAAVQGARRRRRRIDPHPKSPPQRHQREIRRYHRRHLWRRPGYPRRHHHPLPGRHVAAHPHDDWLWWTWRGIARMRGGGMRPTA